MKAQVSKSKIKPDNLFAFLPFELLLFTILCMSGTSSMFGLFVENGPFMINDKGYLDYRAHSWTMTHSVLYIDSPVGTGMKL